MPFVSSQLARREVAEDIHSLREFISKSLSRLSTMPQSVRDSLANLTQLAETTLNQTTDSSLRTSLQTMLTQLRRTLQQNESSEVVRDVQQGSADR